MEITIATSIKYGNYKHLKNRVKQLIKLLHGYLPSYTKEYDLPEDINIHFRPIKGTTYGRAFQYPVRVEVDPRLTDEEFIRIMAHEFVHCEQYKQSRLDFEQTDRGWVSYWNGTAHADPKNHIEYLLLPWEIEAHTRADEFVERYFCTKKGTSL
jgi:hypothetical protein